jgi:hypothetical protein
MVIRKKYFNSVSLSTTQLPSNSTGWTIELYFLVEKQISVVATTGPATIQRMRDCPSQ